MQGSCMSEHENKREEIQRIKASNPDISHMEAFSSAAKNCITLVDYYAPLFFLEISTIQPEEFYLKVNLCQLITYIPLQVQEDTSGFCEDIVSTLLAKF
ncbi:hypothetical protein D0Y65_009887 [Glycine soja]|uniref:YABBY protein C-terminal domain-containing protein n=1 Tax=Glycine soja TaxID=3848 RepID=A0A445L0X1_GLYSO|nr:hypothetical protein D0Y65_009887 [Glycine soja]